MKIRLVCDTNILISALIFPGGNPDKVIQLARTKEIELCISPFILSEFERVLKEKFNYGENEVKKRLEKIINISTIVNPKEHILVVTEDEADNRILECAIKAKADFIVSGDKHLLNLKEFNKIPIIKATELVLRLA